MRAFPRGVGWGPLSGYSAYGFHRARVPHMCHHLPEEGGFPLRGPCVGHVRAGEYYLSVEHGPRSHQTKIAFACAVHSGLLTDVRLTAPLLETLVCAANGILNWYPGTGIGMDVWITGDNGTANFSQAAQDAAGWLRRNGFAEIDEAYPDLIVPTAKGHSELAAWREECARRPLWQP